MTIRNRFGRMLVVGVVLVLCLGACGRDASAPEVDNEGAKVAPVKGSKVKQVTLTAAAMRRLDVTLAPVASVAGGSLTTVPYAAVLYDPSGATWAFVSMPGRAFQRASIAVDHIDGDLAFLTNGPAVGTNVVIVGASELYGAEQGVGDDE